MTALSALAAAAFSPPPEGSVPPDLEACVREACAGAWRAVEVVLAGDLLRGRLAKTRDSIVRDAVEGVLALFGAAAVRPDALAALRAAREAGALDGELDLVAIVATVRIEGAIAAGRGAIPIVRRALADQPELEVVLADPELASLLIDAARAVFRGLARDPELARWAIGPTGSPHRDRALAAFTELVGSRPSLDELEALIALPMALDDNVQFTVYRPRAIDPGKWHQLLAFAHLAERRPGEDDLPDPVEEVQRQAQQVLGERARGYQPVTQDAGSAIPAEGELTFVPELPGIEVNPPRRSFLWLETVHREEFRIRAPVGLDGKTIRGRVTVFLGSIAIAEVALTVRVDAARPEPTRREPAVARTYRKIFASYSHRDIAIVNQFESYARALGDEYLRDWVHLRTGEVWNDRLRQLIEGADAFQLFWSWNSMHSKFVRQEYEHAIALDRPSFVRPTYWEEPMPTAPGLPPDNLLRLHFQKLGGTVRATAEQLELADDARRKRKADAMEHERERAPEPEAAATVDFLARNRIEDREDDTDVSSIDSLSDTGKWADEDRELAEPPRPAPPRPTESAPLPIAAIAGRPPENYVIKRDTEPMRAAPMAEAPPPARREARARTTPGTSPPVIARRAPQPSAAQPVPPSELRSPAPSPAPQSGGPRPSPMPAPSVPAARLNAPQQNPLAAPIAPAPRSSPPQQPSAARPSSPPAQPPGDMPATPARPGPMAKSVMAQPSERVRPEPAPSSSGLPLDPAHNATPSPARRPADPPIDTWPDPITEPAPLPPAEPPWSPKPDEDAAPAESTAVWTGSPQAAEASWSSETPIQEANADASFSWPEPSTPPSPISWSDEVIAGPAPAPTEEPRDEPKARKKEVVAARPPSSPGKLPTTLRGSPPPAVVGRTSLPPVSPYAPTMQQEAYQPEPGELESPQPTTWPTAPNAGGAAKWIALVVLLLAIAAIVIYVVLR